MTPDQILIAHLVKVLVWFTLVGIVWRGRARLCWSFVAYLLAVVTSNSLVTFWPETFFTKWFWILQQGLDDALKAAIAVELSFRTFLVSPRIRPIARAVLASLLVIVFLVLVVLTGEMTHGMTWLFTGLVGMILWYQVPVDTYQKAILFGFAPYLLVFGVLWTLLGKNPSLLRTVQWADPAAYTLLMAFWVWAAWRHNPAPRAGSGTTAGSPGPPGDAK